MSNSKIAVAKIKGLMKEFGFLSEEIELLSFGLQDENKTIIQTSKLEVGNTIMKINEEFNQVPLEDGSFKLKENFEISVENGVITSVRELFIDAKLIDGTKVKVEGEALVEGAKVYVITEEYPDGIMAPNGTHELDGDGTKVTTVDGVITAIEEKVDAADMPGAEMPVGGEEVKDAINEQEGILDGEILDMLKEFMVRFGEKMKKMEEKMNTMNAEFNAFKKEPAAQPIKTGKIDFTQERLNEEDGLVQAIMNLRKNK
jgi:hypothetical protein